jgi:hypothetical protein
MAHSTGDRHLLTTAPDGQAVTTAGPAGHRPPPATLGGRTVRLQQHGLERQAVLP